MSDEQKERAAFSAADIKALQYLAIVLGLVVAGIAYVSKAAEAQLLAIGLAAAMMIVSPLAIFLFRRRKSRGK